MSTAATPDAARSPRTPEVELAAVVVSWLAELGADTYQEVELARGGIRADIVARVGPELWIIETKASLSIALLGQCMERRRFAHRVYAAAPCRKLRFGDELFRDVGVGLLDVRLGSQHAWDPPRIVEIVRSKRWNTRPVALASALRPEHKTHARAGAPTGGHWTPFRETCENLARAVTREPGITLKAAIAAIEHHYRSIPARARAWRRGSRPARCRASDSRPASCTRARARRARRRKEQRHEASAGAGVSPRCRVRSPSGRSGRASSRVAVPGIAPRA